MKRQFIIFTTLFLIASATAVQAQKLDVGVQSAIIYQSLTQSNDDDTLPEIGPGFQNALGNLTFLGEAFDGGDVVVDLFISSKHHTETWGYQGYFKMSKLPAWMNTGAFGEFYDEHLSVRAGQMSIRYGDSYLFQSINGDVYNNDLVGNPVTVPAFVTLGAEATLSAGMGELMLGFSNGTTSGTVEKGKGIALHGKASVMPFDDNSSRFSASFYKVDHSENGTGYPAGGTKSYLYSQGDRGGSRYDIWSGPDGGQIFFGKEQDVTSFQLDARLDFNPILVYGYAGMYKDADGNGSAAGEPEDEWTYYMVTGKYSLTEWFYLAARYSASMASQLGGTEIEGTVDRIQLGGGFILNPGVKIKLEWVKQTTDGFNLGMMGGGANLGLNPEFSGISIETAVRL